MAGWGGAALLLLAYGLLSAGRLGARSLIYHLLNLLGSAGLIINGVWHGAVPSAALNLIWMAIAVATMVRIRGEPAVSSSPVPSKGGDGGG